MQSGSKIEHTHKRMLIYACTHVYMFVFACRYTNRKMYIDIQMRKNMYCLFSNFKTVCTNMKFTFGIDKFTPSIFIS